LSGLEIRDWLLRFTGKEDPRQRNREACTGGKLQKRRISNIEQGILNDELRRADKNTKFTRLRRARVKGKVRLFKVVA
jgi:hypothetical protein